MAFTDADYEKAEALFAQAGHWSADSLYAQVSEGEPATSKATVYNTLNLFRAQGLLRTVDVDPTRQFYDSSTVAHHHFYNVDTGELTDIPLDSVLLQVATALPPGTEQVNGIPVHELPQGLGPLLAALRTLQQRHRGMHGAQLVAAHD